MNKPKVNGSGKRRLASWIDKFIDQTSNLGSPELFRKWVAISIVGSVLEQKVYLQTSSPLFANIFVFIIGHPGTGKTRCIRAGREYFKKLPEPLLCPKSVTFASLTDFLARSKRFIARLPDDPLDYEYGFICPDEIGTFIKEYDNEMVDGLSAFYDNDDYGQDRRGNDLRLRLKSPLISILAGATPERLMKLLPPHAWGQGFTSRTMMIFSDERTIIDDFAPVEVNHSADLEHDLEIINGLAGKFEVTRDYRDAVNAWKNGFGDLPAPSHPRLIHYVTRRPVHLYKLSMIAAIDRSNTLILTKDDFNRAMGWLLEAEENMSDIFKAGETSADGQALDEIVHFITINDRGNGVSEQKITRFASDLIPIHSILRVIEIMERGGKIHRVAVEKRTGIRYYSIRKEAPPSELQ